jgi:ABC-type nitrate/sulfonate/bicarbonate transport system substrate-binding protein
MTKSIFSALTGLILLLATAAPSRSQSEKLDRIRVARASDSATEAALWFAKEGGFFEKHGIAAELIRFQGSSLVVSTMLAGEVAISQIGAAAVVDSGLAGGDLINVASIIRNFVFYIFSRPEIERMADLKGKAMGTSRYGAISDFAARFALAKNGLQPEKDVAILQTGGPFRERRRAQRQSYSGCGANCPGDDPGAQARPQAASTSRSSKRIFPSTASSWQELPQNNENLLRRFMMASHRRGRAGEKGRAVRQESHGEIF